RTLAEVRKRGGELRVPCEQLIGGPHRRVPDVVADSGEIPEADQLPSAELRARAADVDVVRVARLEPHRRPDLQRHAALSVSAVDVVTIRPAVVEQVELEQLHTLVFEVEQGAVDATTVRSEMADV